MLVASIVLLVLAIGGGAAAIVFYRRDEYGPSGTLAIVSTLLLVLGTIAGWLALAPEYRLHKASIEKRILVEQAKAEADAAVEEARAEVERAKGTAEANLIVADSITEPYLRYLYINSLKNTDNQVIYLPTEAGLPMLEADRLNQK